MWIQLPSLLGKVQIPISHLQTGCANHQNEAQAWEERAKSSLEITQSALGLWISPWYTSMQKHACFVSNSPLEERPKAPLGEGCSPSPAHTFTLLQPNKTCILACPVAVSSGGWRAAPPGQAYSLVITTRPWEVEASISWTHHQTSLQPWWWTAWFSTPESKVVEHR